VYYFLIRYVVLDLYIRIINKINLLHSDVCVYVRIIKMCKSQYFLLSYETRFLKYFVYVDRETERREI